MQYIIQQTAACCVLHNLCEMQEEEFQEDFRVELDADSGQNYEDYEDDDGAEAVRNVLKTFLEHQGHL
jgi:hypothetical protein